MSVAKDLIDYIHNDGTLNLQKNVNMFLGPMQDTSPFPDNAVFISTRGGRLPERVMGLKSEVRYPIVFINIRNRDFGVGHDLSLAIVNFLMVAKITGYFDLDPLQSEPDYIQFDNKNRHHWNLAYLMTYEHVNA